jgi:hypothetical protein
VIPLFPVLQRIRHGEFSIHGAPAGRYNLSVNFTVPPVLEKPFETIFYPQVFERERAKVFEIALGERVKNLIFRSPPRIKAQKMTGKIVFPDGAPAAGMTVNLQKEDSSDSFSDTQTNENGDFVIEGFVGENYNFGVEYYGDESEKAEYTVKKSVLRSMKIRRCSV